MNKAILINSEKKTLSYIQLSDDNNDIYKAIGNNCCLFCIPVQFENMDSLFADDESLLRHNDIKGGFIMDDWSTPIVGNAVIIGTDDEGDSIDCKTTIDDIKGKIRFFSADTCKQYAEIVMSTPPKVYSF